MEVGRKHIHVLTDSYEIWQKHFVRKIPKGQRSHAEAAEVQVAGVIQVATMRLNRRKEKSRKKWIVLTLTPLVVTFYLGFLSLNITTALLIPH